MRVAKYRHVEGWSAQKLAAAAGLTRSVIANIENGRRPDVTVGELTKIAFALRVPLVALMLPVDRPFDQVQTGNSDHTVAGVVKWITGNARIFDGLGPAGIQAHRLLSLADMLWTARRRIQTVRVEIYENAKRCGVDLDRLAFHVDRGEVSDSPAGSELVSIAASESAEEGSRARAQLHAHDEAFGSYRHIEGDFRDIGGDTTDLPQTHELWARLEHGEDTHGVDPATS